MKKGSPFSGIKVVELSTFVAAPTCGRILADWGADVIKVEPLEGETWRTFGKNYKVPFGVDENPVFDVVNTNKKSLALNLKSEKGLKIMHSLLEKADVFITNNRISPLKKLGLDYETLKIRYPRLIYALLTGYGELGPDEAKPGFDTAAFWSAGGFLADMRVDNPGSYPISTPLAFGDIICGTALFGGVAAALMVRERTGKGDKISVSLFGTAVWASGIMNTIAQDQYGWKYPLRREDCNPVATVYMCADGEWIMPTLSPHERYFSAFCRAMGLPDLADDPKFNTREAAMQPENRASLIKILEERFSTQSADYWNRVLTAEGIVNNRAAHYRDICKSEQARVNHFVEEVTFRNGNTAWLPRPSIQSENLGLPAYEPSHALGEDSVRILEDIGFTPEEISDLISTNVLGV